MPGKSGLSGIARQKETGDGSQSSTLPTGPLCKMFFWTCCCPWGTLSMEHPEVDWHVAAPKANPRRKGLFRLALTIPENYMPSECQQHPNATFPWSNRPQITKCLKFLQRDAGLRHLAFAANGVDLWEPIKGSGFPLHCRSLTLLKNGQDPLIHQELAVDLTALLHRRQGDGLVLVGKLHLSGEVSRYWQIPSCAIVCKYRLKIWSWFCWMFT